MLDDPWSHFVYCERYVNDGSPSGFTVAGAVTEATSPLGDAPSFKLFSFSDRAAEVIQVGDLPAIHADLPPDGVLIHPDVATNLDSCVTEFAAFEVAPTASARTVHVLEQEPFHLKLHYPATIGRMDRSLGMREALYAIYISRLLSDAISSGALPRTFGILPENGARVIRRSARPADDLGMVYRSLTPDSRDEAAVAIVPAFSLFSRDRYRPQAPPLVLDMWRASDVPAFEFLTRCLLLPLIDSYFAVLLRTGLQGEFHAQNILIGLNQHAFPKHILLRDMESVDTDLSLQQELGLSPPPPPSTHKCLDRSMPNYQIKHSFMFDFKLGQYLLEPIITVFANAGLVDADAVMAEVRNGVHAYTQHLPSDFFPRNCWYSFDRIQIDRSTAARPYVKHEGTLFR